jgi:hypothetical protein
VGLNWRKGVLGGDSEIRCKRGKWWVAGKVRPFFFEFLSFNWKFGLSERFYP